MTGTDLVVVLPGIMGSTLRRADGKLVWAPSAGAALRAIVTLAGSIKQLTLDPDIGDQAPDDGVEPVDLMPDLHVLPGIWTPIKGYTRLLDKLTSLGYHPGANLLPVPYDWRLSNRYNGRRLACIVEPALQRWRDQSPANADAQLVFVCHSMGGLVARWYIEKCGGAELTRRLITFGTPYRGAAKTVDQLVNGVRPSLGPLAVDLTTFARSLPSLHQLLPEYACIEHGTIKYGTNLAKTTEVTLPELATRLVTDAMTFHTELNDAEAARPASLDSTHAIVGTRQPTITTIRIDGHRAIPLETIGDDNDYGDATVPLAGGIRHGLALDTNRIDRVADHHGNLQRNGAALDVLAGILTAKPVVRRDAHATAELRVTVPELVLAGENLPVTVTTVAVTEDGTARQAITITVRDEAGTVVASAVPRLRKGHAETAFPALPPGAYAVQVTGLATGSGVAPVSAAVLIWADPA
ncbi:MAG: esterase/lipase family protein [Acidimicrobiales bacterium]